MYKIKSEKSHRYRLQFYRLNHFVVVKWFPSEEELPCWSRSEIDSSLVRNYQLHMWSRGYEAIVYGPFEYPEKNLFVGCTSHPVDQVCVFNKSGFSFQKKKKTLSTFQTDEFRLILMLAFDSFVLNNTGSGPDFIS